MTAPPEFGFWNGKPKRRWCRQRKRCLELGANVHMQDNGGNTPLHMAAQRSPNADGVRLLVSLEKVDVNAENNRGETPMGVANTDEKKEILRAAGGVE